MSLRHITLFILLATVFNINAHANNNLRSIQCESATGTYQYCQVETFGIAQLQQQLSRATCQQGYSWGYDTKGVWVDKGCRAQFLVGTAPARNNAMNNNNVVSITCASNDGSYQYCPANTYNGVILQRQLSKKACIQDKTWGYDNGGIWVEGGCRAEFSLATPNRHRHEDNDDNRNSRNNNLLVTCFSEEGSYRHCPTRIEGHVTLKRQLSRADCIEGSTWGYDQRGIWVDGGCRAEFIVNNNRRNSANRDNRDNRQQTMTCASNDGGYRYCAARTNGSVTLQQQLSRNTCEEGYSWGYDAKGIWVDKGCRGEFLIGEAQRRYREPSPRQEGVRFTCQARGEQSNYCPIELRGRYVKLTKQLSRAECVEGRTWGYDDGGVWVTGGCRAEFLVE